MLQKLAHLVDAADPRAVERELLVQQQRARLEGDGTALSEVDYPSPLAGGLQTQLPSCGAPRAVHADLRAMTAGEIQHHLSRALCAHQDVRGASALRQFQALGDQVDAYDLSAAGGGEHDRPEPDWTETDDEDPVPAGDAGTQYPLIRGPEPAGHEGAVGEGKLVGQVEQGAGFGQEVVGVASVALPAVRGALGRTTPDHEPLAALLAAPAAQDVVDDYPISRLETTHARSH